MNSLQNIQRFSTLINEVNSSPIPRFFHLHPLMLIIPGSLILLLNFYCFDVSIRSVAREMLGTIDQLIMDHFGQTWHTLDTLYPNQNEIHSG